MNACECDLINKLSNFFSDIPEGASQLVNKVLSLSTGFLIEDYLQTGILDDFLFQIRYCIMKERKVDFKNILFFS